MGRGRQKAKHTKVARELKYFSPDTNYSALEKELATEHSVDYDKWSEYADAEDEELEDDFDDEEVEEEDAAKSA